jgi:hypothetical protein
MPKFVLVIGNKKESRYAFNLGGQIFGSKNKHFFHPLCGLPQRGPGKKRF